MCCVTYTPNPALKMEAASFSEYCVVATKTRGDTYQKAYESILVIQLDYRGGHNPADGVSVSLCHP